jgi:hypothetical protein
MGYVEPKVSVTCPQCLDHLKVSLADAVNACYIQRKECGEYEVYLSAGPLAGILLGS